MYLFNNAHNHNLSSILQDKIVSVIEKFKRLKKEEFKKQIQIIQETPVIKFLIQSINYIFKN